MVSQANATRGSREAIDYIQTDHNESNTIKKPAFELDRNLIAGETPAEILQEFRETQAQRPRVKNNTYSIYLSPDVSQADFSKDELRELGREHLKNLGLDKHQYLMTLHELTGRPHIHLQVNRISMDGRTHNDSFISKKAQSSAEKLAKERGLFTAKEIRQMQKEQTKELRAEIYKAFNQSQYNAQSLDEFQRNMWNKGYTVNLSENKQGKIQGFRIVDRQSGQDFKASEIHRNVRFPKLMQRIEQNREKEREIKKQQERTRSRGWGFSR